MLDRILVYEARWQWRRLGTSRFAGKFKLLPVMRNHLGFVCLAFEQENGMIRSATPRRQYSSVLKDMFRKQGCGSSLGSNIT